MQCFDVANCGCHSDSWLKLRTAYPSRSQTLCIKHRNVSCFDWVIYLAHKHLCIIYALYSDCLYQHSSSLHWEQPIVGTSRSLISPIMPYTLGPSYTRLVLCGLGTLQQTHALMFMHALVAVV